VLSKQDDEQVARVERARKIGLFRYMLIREAADPTLTGRQRGKLVRALAAMTHTDPDGRSIRISRWTLDRWVSEWQRAGFDALVPSPRQSQPRTPADPRRRSAGSCRFSTAGPRMSAPCSGCSCAPA
jgi:putative transposase